jgi:hypothetical protein
MCGIDYYAPSGLVNAGLHPAFPDNVPSGLRPAWAQCAPDLSKHRMALWTEHRSIASKPTSAWPALKGRHTSTTGEVHRTQEPAASPALKGRHTPPMGEVHRTHEPSAWPALKGRHTPTMGEVHRNHEAPASPALKGRHTPTMGEVHRTQALKGRYIRAYHLTHPLHERSRNPR